MPTTQAKTILHAQARDARRALTGEERKRASAAITERAFLRLAGTEGLIGVYAPFGDELHPGALIERLAVSGRALALPCTPKWGCPLVFRAWAIGDPLVKGRMNIPEPSHVAPEVWPAVLVVPPVAFDRRCFRIGYGAGFYDRTIPALRSRHPVFVLGIAFSCQEIEAAPDEPHDVPLDEIATERELIIAPAPPPVSSEAFIREIDRASPAGSTMAGRTRRKGARSHECGFALEGWREFGGADHE